MFSYLCTDEEDDEDEEDPSIYTCMPTAFLDLMQDRAGMLRTFGIRWNVANVRYSLECC